MPELAQWHRVRLLFKNGSIIDLFDDGTHGLIECIPELMASDEAVILAGVRALPLIVKVKVFVHPDELAAAEISECDHITFNLAPNNLEQAAATGLT